MTATMATGWVWQPAISPMQIFGAAGVVAALAIFAYARTFRARKLGSAALLLMRLAVIAALAVVLMGPSAVPPRTEQLRRPEMHVLLDTSASMQTEDCDGLSRIEFARQRWLSPARRRELADGVDLRFYRFDGELRRLGEGELDRPAAALADGQVTRLSECVRNGVLSVAQGSRETALLVLSDGHDSDDTPTQPVALLARARGVPVHAVCLGGPSLRRDLVLVALPEQRYLFEGETGHVVAKVHQAGLQRAATQLHLRFAGEDLTRPVRFDGERTVTLRLPIKAAQAGLHRCELSVDPVAGEAEQGNNSQSVFLEVTGKRIRVLLLEGEPYWETKFIAQSLRKDARVELVQITRLSEQKTETIVTRAEQQTTRLPASPEEFARYSVVVLGRGLEHLLTPQTVKLLSSFVADQGGHVVFARGRAYDEQTAQGRQLGRDLAVLEPVVWGRGQLNNLALSLTPSGRASPCFAFTGAAADAHQAVARLPGFTVMPAVAREKAATIVLARALPRGRAATAGEEGVPALVSMNYGRGRVVAVLGEGLWRWGMLPPELAKYDGLYDVFWSNLIRWLAMGSDFLPGQNVSLRLGRSSVRLGDPVLLDVVCKLAPQAGFQPSLKVHAPDGKAHDVLLKRQAGAASRLQGEFQAGQKGVHRVVLDSPGSNPPQIERKFSVYHVDFERLDSSARPRAMQMLAQQSGGLSLAADEPAKLPKALARLRALQEVPQRPRFLWDKGLLLAMLLMWAGAEWLLRRKAGLP